MPNRQLYDRIERLTKQTLLQLHELEQISEELQKVIEENHNLTMENRHLKDRLDELEPNTHTKKVAKKKKKKPIHHQLRKYLRPRIPYLQPVLWKT